MELYLEKLNQLISENPNQKTKTFEELDSTGKLPCYPRHWDD